MVAPWVLQEDYTLGIEHALAGNKQHYIQIKNKEEYLDFQIAYMEGYEAGQRKLLINLIKEDPK